MLLASTRLIRRVRHRLRSAIGRDFYIARQRKVPVEYHGSACGGWAIMKNSLSSDSVVYSVGIGEDASFDLSLIARYGCTVHAFDPTPRSKDWVGRHCVDFRFRFFDYALAGRDGQLRLFQPKNTEHVSASLNKSSHTSDIFFDAPCYRLMTVMSQLGHSHIDVLKMDVEGAEYEIISDLIQTQAIDVIGQLLIEFHHWMPGIDKERTRDAVRDLERQGLKAAWVSDWGYEVLFSRHQ